MKNTKAKDVDDVKHARSCFFLPLFSAFLQWDRCNECLKG